MHIEIQSFLATAAGAAGTAGTPLTGDSATVRNARGPARALAAWSSRQVAGFSQYITPTMHDTTRGFRTGVAIGSGLLTVALGQALLFQPQEVIANTIAGSAVGGDIELDSLLLFYDNMPGISSRGIKAAEATSRAKELVNIESSVAAVATGQYSEELITADSDTLRANTDYAVLGMSSRTACHAMTMSSPDFGNVRVGCPGLLRPELTQQWFTMLSRIHDVPCVPVFNSGNRAQTRLGFCTDENAAATLITLHLAML